MELMEQTELMSTSHGSQSAREHRTTGSQDGMPQVIGLREPQRVTGQDGSDGNFGGATYDYTYNGHSGPTPQFSSLSQGDALLG